MMKYRHTIHTFKNASFLGVVLMAEYRILMVGQIGVFGETMISFCHDFLRAYMIPTFTPDPLGCVH